MKKPWKLTETLAHPRILNESYPMNTNMTGLRWILIIFAFFFIDNLPGSLSMGYLFYLQVYFGSITNPCRSFTRLCTSTGTPSSFHILPACTSKYQPQMNKSKWIGNQPVNLNNQAAASSPKVTFCPAFSVMYMIQEPSLGFVSHTDSRFETPGIARSSI